MMTSPDGITWTPRGIALDSTFMADVAYSPTLGLLVAVGVQGAGQNGFRTSTDGITWIEKAVPVNSDYNSIMWSVEKAMFLVGGSVSGIITSTDGVTWVTRDNTKDINDITYSPALDKFVAIWSNSDGVSTSTDGITWAQHAGVLGAGAWNSVAWSPSLDLFVVVDAALGGIKYSSNGTSWTLAGTIPSGQRDIVSVKWFPVEGKFIAVDSDTASTSAIISSVDGDIWVTESLLSSLPDDHRPTDIARKSATEWVVTSGVGMGVLYSIANPF